ncbi:META domain-containing protein [Nocardia sp. NPDC049190]|uniref:META domain-containing protein n=1 Tax=Nocardia sp. NPDC049190 TaxID=3155650 RepID=UPI003405A7A1
MAALFARVGPVALCALCMIVACSCGGPDNNVSTPSPMGRTFVSTGVEGTPIPGGGPLTISFTDGRISADAGCNKHTGAVTLDHHTVHVSGLASTLMACAGERVGADAWLADLLHSPPNWRLEGARLTLRGDNRTVTLFDKKVAQPDKPIKGTSWLVIALITADAQIRSQAIDHVKPALTIAQDGSVSGATGCNRMTGSADVSGSEITFRIATTKMLCSSEAMEVEQAVLKALDGKVIATVDADTLTLRNGNGKGLTLHAQ